MLATLRTAKVLENRDDKSSDFITREIYWCRNVIGEPFT
jgi:hypothetical protein